MRLTPTLATAAVTLAAGLSAGLGAAPAVAATTTATFGWEDGVSTTTPGSFRVGDAANVAAGSEVDYGTADVPQSTYDVTPIGGTRMLRATETDTTGSNPGAYLALIDNLDVGDTVSYGFRGFDPTDGRSPSVLPALTYFENNDPTDFGGFASPFVEFAEFPGSGWLDFTQSVNFGDGSFDGDGSLQTGVAIQAQLFAPSASLPANGGPGTYSFFLDDLTVTVTTSNPDATLTLPDGSVISLAAVPEPTSLGLLGVAGLGLLRRRRA